MQRRAFFGTTAGGLAAVSGVAAANVTRGPYDFAAIWGRFNLPFAHRQAFGSARLADGAALHFMLNSLNAYEFDYGEGPGALHALGIFYGTSVGILLDDEAWRKYQLDLVQQRRGDAAKRAAQSGGNPYLRATSRLDAAVPRSDLHGLYHDQSLTALAARRASFFACDNALLGLATDVAVTYGISTDPLQSVHADLRAHLVRGVLLVPAGVAAINEAQELKFTFMPASI